ncbi:winged helix-turn-helix transcriptional regulator [Thalassotalea fusca]
MTALPTCHTSRSPCAIANGLEILGDKWTLLIIRDLMFTNRNEFGHLLQSSEGISTNILTERLHRLQKYHVIEKLPHPSHGKKSVYRLTEHGIALFPVLIEFMLWAKRVIDGCFIPEDIYQLMQNDRDSLFEKVKNRQPLVVLPL